MLATMRPAPIHATDSSLKQQYVSHQSNTSSKPRNRSTQMNESNGSARPKPKKGNTGTGKQLAPGLLSLSKPLDEFQDSDDAENLASTTSKKNIKKKKQQITSAEPTSVAATNNAPNASSKPKKKALAIDEIKANENQLSRSAPDSHSSSDWEMPKSAKLTKEASTNAAAALTWQQQLLNSQAPKSAPLEKKKGGKKDRSANSSIKSKSSQAVDANKDEASSALTWQQELFGSNSKSRGPAFDVFADERDALTFGGNAPNQASNKGGKKKQRQRADSLGDIDLHANHNAAAHSRPNKPKGNNQSSFVHLAANDASSSSPSSGPPTTPNKLAYAGPNFHNSPSPASLPVPKFLQSKNGGSVNGTGISSNTNTNATSNSSIFAREAQAQQQQQQQSYQQPQMIYHHPPPPPYPPFARYPHPGPYNHPAQYIDPNISISSHSSDEEQDASFSHSKSRYIRGVTAPPELPSTPLLNGKGDESVSSVDNNRNETIENLLARMMRPGSD